MPTPEHNPERRRCSDEECMKARTVWFEKEIMPKLVIRFWIGLAITLGSLTGASVYLTGNAIRDYKLEAVGFFQTQTAHNKDVNEIKESMHELSGNVTHTVNRILENQKFIMDNVKKK